MVAACDRALLLDLDRNEMAKSRFNAVILGRCPICLEGPVFRSLLGMYKDCPRCGVHYERETGYFLNAMFFAYVIGFLIIAPTALYLYIRGTSTFWFTIIISAELLLLWPWIFRYSRILWLHVDQLLDPRPNAPRPNAPRPSDPTP
jgi:uncharacterized protein (DUF983 family)